MIEPNIFGIGLDADMWDLNTAEALGFTSRSSSHENPFIIPDCDNDFEFLKKIRTVAIA